MSALFIAPMTFSLMTPYQFMGLGGTYYETTLEKKIPPAQFFHSNALLYI